MVFPKSKICDRKYEGESYLFGFQGMEQEPDQDETQYHTLFRQYDAVLGRWWSSDPEQQKFSSFSPYLALGANPVNMVDPLGDDVTAKDKKSQDAVRSSVEDEFEEYVRFNKDGKVDAQYLADNLPTDIDPNSNAAILQRLAENPENINVMVTEEVPYTDSEGKFDKGIFYQKGDSNFDPEKGIWAAGLTTIPNNSLNKSLNPDVKKWSHNDEINVYINPNPAYGSIDVIAAHEIYGHGRLTIMKKMTQHKEVDKIEMNKTLERLVQQAEKNAGKPTADRKKE